MSIFILKPGILTTIQDFGRCGYQKYGIPVSGAMDTYSMRLSNILVGNCEKEGVFEFTLAGPELEIKKGNLIAITGADMLPTIDGRKVPMNRPVYLKEDCILKFGACVNGCRTYLAIGGGLDIHPVMGSKSTYIRGKIGGFKGRALIKGDLINVGEKSRSSKEIINNLIKHENKEDFVYPKWYIENCIFNNSKLHEIRVFEDRQYKELSEKSRYKLFNSEFKISSQSDRMGYRLQGPEIKLKRNIEMISGEVSFGTVQLPPGGQPIILLADRATAGGYPKIAHIAACDIQKLVQCKPGEKIRVKKITVDEAEKLYLNKEKYIEKIKRSVEFISI